MQTLLMKILGKNYKLDIDRNMTVFFLSGSLRGNSLFAPVLSYETWLEDVIYFSHNTVICNNSNYPEFI